MKNKTAAIILTFHKRLFTVLVFSIVLLLSFYIFFVSKSIVNALVREELQNEIVTINSDIGDLESQYIVLKNVVDIEFAYSLGFTDVVEKKFVTRRSVLGKQLTVNNEI
jgi:hypothetical protein